MKKNDKIKATLTIQQSLNLQNLGIDIRLASWYETAGSTSPNGCGGQTVTNFPVFTIADLLSILPKEIEGYGLEISSVKDGYYVSYILWDNTDDYDFISDSLNDKPFSAPELIDSLYQLLIWAIEHNYVNIKNEKK